MKNLLILIFGGLIFISLNAKSLIIFDAEKNMNSFSRLKKYNSSVKRLADKDNKIPGMSQSMLIETFKQDLGKGTYWYIFNSCSWGGTNGNTMALRSQPIEIEFFISPAEAMSLPDNGSPTKYLDNMSAMRFCFGSGSRKNSIKILLRRSFFQLVDQNTKELQVKQNRTGKWIIISILRDEKGRPVKLKVKKSSNDKYEEVKKSEYAFQVDKIPDWKHSNYIAIECWGKSPDNFSFNISRISIGKMPLK